MSYFDKFNNRGVKFMDNATKGDIKSHLNEKLHIMEFAFLTNDEGDYAVFTTAEHEGEFFFGNAILTEALHQIENDGQSKALQAQPIVFTERKSKKGRTYVAFEFVTEDIPF